MTVFRPLCNPCLSLGEIGCGVCVPTWGTCEDGSAGFAQPAPIFFRPGSSARAPAHQVAKNQPLDSLLPPKKWVACGTTPLRAESPHPGVGTEDRHPLGDLFDPHLFSDCSEGSRQQLPVWDAKRQQG